MSHPARHPRAQVALAALALACSTLLTLGSAQAQSSYTLATLKSSNSFAVTPLALDSQNNVLGTAYYYDSFGSLLFGAEGIPLFGGMGYIYVTEASKWPAGTSTSVSPTRVIKSGTHQSLMAASADGSKLATFSALYETASAKLIYYISDLNVGMQQQVTSYKSPRMVANDGSLALTVDVYSDAPGVSAVRRAGVTRGTLQASFLLPLGNYTSSTAGTISPSGAIVGGTVVEPSTGFDRAAVWISEQLSVLDSKPNRGSSVTRLNATGQALACTLAGVSTLVNGANGPYFQIGYSKPVHVLITNGVEQAIAPLTAGQVATAWALNASGTVVGRSGPLSVQQYLPLSPQYCTGTASSSSRAFIWRNGVTTDLTTWATSKGVKLPTGAVLADAYDINDAGSILAIQRASNGTLSYVRLTAKP
jgi:uncharacterized membrane protein